MALNDSLIHMKNCQLLLPFLFLIACAPKEDSEPSTSAPVDSQQSPGIEPVTEVDGVVVVAMTGNDQMRYNVESIPANAGQTVRITLTNIGRMPKAAMGHNVVILKAGADADAFVAAAAQAKGTDYIPETKKDAILAHTKLLGPGETDTIEFVAPSAGNYTFLCSFPAHLYAGMRGNLLVQ